MKVSTKIFRVGVDIAKSVFQIHAVDQAGKTVWTRKLQRDTWIEDLCQRIGADCEIGMEACGGAHHWARVLQARGFIVKLMAPQFVKPYVKGNKNDANDAEAICEAMSRPNMRFVPMKTVEQQDLQAAHRIRSEIVGARTAKANQIRGLVAEYGLIAPKQIEALRRAIPIWLEDTMNGLTVAFRQQLLELQEDLKALDIRVAGLDARIEATAKRHPQASRLMQLRGIGPITATAIIATIGDGSQFKNGRQMAASIGLTPRQHSSGGKDRLLGISKRGDSYLRSLLIHGARAVLRGAKQKTDRLSTWLNGIALRRHPNVAATALANKTARIAWAMLRTGTDYQPNGR